MAGTNVACSAVSQQRLSATARASAWFSVAAGTAVPSPISESGIPLSVGAPPKISPVTRRTSCIPSRPGSSMSTEPKKRNVLMYLAAEGVVPVLGGCAGALIAGPQGGIVGLVVGQAVEKAI